MVRFVGTKDYSTGEMMAYNMIVKIDTFEFETRYASQEYVECGLSIHFEETGREFKFVFDNGSLKEILSEVDMYFNGAISQNTETVYFVPWVAGNCVVYPLTFLIDVEKRTWLFRYKSCQNNSDFDYIYEMNEDEVRSMYNQIKKQYEAIAWNVLGKSELYTFDFSEKEYQWCYSAKRFEALFAEIAFNQEIRAIYVSAANYRDPLKVEENFVNYYIGSEIVIELDDIIIDLLIYAQGLYQWRCFDKKDVAIIGPRLDFIEDGDEEFCKIEDVYHAFEFEYLNSRIKAVSVEKTSYIPWCPHGFDKSKLDDPIELPENLIFELENGNRLSFLGWDDDFVIKIENSESK